MLQGNSIEGDIMYPNICEKLFGNTCMCGWKENEIRKGRSLFKVMTRSLLAALSRLLRLALAARRNKKMFFSYGFTKKHYEFGFFSLRVFIFLLCWMLFCLTVALFSPQLIPLLLEHEPFLLQISLIVYGIRKLAKQMSHESCRDQLPVLKCHTFSIA